MEAEEGRKESRQLRFKNYEIGPKSLCEREKRERCTGETSYALRKSKAAEPGLDHALGPSSEGKVVVVVEGVRAPLVVFVPFVKASGCCFISVIMT